MPAGYGTDHPGEGACCKHAEVVQQDRARIKGEFLVAYDHFKVMRRACEVVDVAERTVHVWRDMDAEFDEAVARLQESLEDRRVRAVEESLFERAVSGKARAAEVLFYLANRAPQRWQDLKRIKHDIELGGGVLVSPGTSEDVDDWEERAVEEQRQLKEETRGREIEGTVREPAED